MQPLFNLSISFSRSTILAGMFVLSFFLRAAVFYYYVQHEERYYQADSMDYHNCAVSMNYGTGMHRPDTGKAIFWRTPGYPLYLSFFYYLCDFKGPGFSQNAYAQKVSIWVQIFISSFIPLISYFLALLLTQSSFIASCVGFILAFHIGFVLASCYLLTEALALFFFLLFLLFIYHAIFTCKRSKSNLVNLLSLGLAAFMLAIYTWMRPNGQFVAVVTLLLILFAKGKPWKLKLKQATLFFLIMATCLAPWYIRNYNLTGSLFFCPMMGPYLLTFCAPKILRTISARPLVECINFLCSRAHYQAQQDELQYLAIASPYAVCKELLCFQYAWPLIKSYPLIFLRDWVREVLKTTFDLYASQLVAFTNNTYKFDPPEEFLSEKLALALYKQEMPFIMRLLCWIELFYSIWLWIGIVLSLCFCGLDLYRKNFIFAKLSQSTILWCTTMFFVIALLAMTGGFGYARLRMPVEPLLLIISLLGWLMAYCRRKKVTGICYEISLCSLA